MRDINTVIYDKLADAIIDAPEQVHSVLSILVDGFFDHVNSQTVKVNQDAIVEAVHIYNDTIINDPNIDTSDYKEKLIEQILESVETFKNSTK